MKARFICNVSNARLLRNRIDKGEGVEAEYVVERVVYLSKREFKPFRERLLEDEPNIAKYQEDMSVVNELKNDIQSQTDIQIEIYKIFYSLCCKLLKSLLFESNLL